MKKVIILILIFLGVQAYSLSPLPRLYHIENDGVYYKKEKINADKKTFRIIGYNNIAKDRKYVYYNGKIISGADPETFEYLNYYYSKDKYNIYLKGKPLNKRDIKTFRVMGAYNKDKNGVYFQENIIKEADPASFKVLYYLYHPMGIPQSSETLYAIDDRYVYYEGRVIKNADLKTFEVTNYNQAKDKKNTYFEDKLKK